MKVKNSLVPAVVIFFVFSVVFSTKVLVGNDYPLISKSVATDSLRLPQTWKSDSANLGEYSVSTLWAWPMNFAYGLLFNLGLDFWIIERALGLLPILVLGYWGINKLLRHEGIRPDARKLASLFYLLNTYIILVIDGGQLAIGLSYAWMPIAYWRFKKSLKEGFKSKLISGLAVAVLGFFDVRFLYPLAILLTLDFFLGVFFREKDKAIKYSSSWVISGLISVVVLVALNFYWIWLSFVAKAPTLPAGFERLAGAESLSFASLLHSLFLVQPHWYQNIFGRIANIPPLFVVVPILVFLAPVVNRRSKRVGYWLLVALLGVFLVKGSQPPLGEVYKWIFANIPGFSLFRDPTKFFFLIAISYTVLLANTFQGLFSKFPKHKNYFGVLFFGFLFVFVSPVWLDKMNGILSSRVDQDKYLSLNQRLENDSEYGKVLWVPRRPPLGYSSVLHPEVAASETVQARPFAVGVVGTYELYNFLRRPYVGPLLAASGFKYLVYPDPGRQGTDLKQDQIDYYNWFVGKIDSYDWSTKIDGLTTFEVEGNKGLIYPSLNNTIVVGSDDLYFGAAEDILETGFVFVEEHPGLLVSLVENDYLPILLNKKTETDLAVNLIEEPDFIFPAKYLDFSPNGQRWWKRETIDLISWRGFLQQKYGIDNVDFDYLGGWAVAEGETRFVLPDALEKDGVLLARILTSREGGSLRFFQGSRPIGGVVTKQTAESYIYYEGGEVDGVTETLNFSESNFLWVEIGEVSKGERIEIATSGNLNAINTLTIVDSQEWSFVKERTRLLVDEGRVFDASGFFESSNKTTNEVSLEYTRISPTKYSVKVSNVKSPTIVVFTQKYDTLWKLDNIEPIPVYSVFNGFVVDRDGTYLLEYSAQRHVLLGFVVSLVSFVVISLTLLLKT